MTWVNKSGSHRHTFTYTVLAGMKLCNCFIIHTHTSMFFVYGLFFFNVYILNLFFILTICYFCGYDSTGVCNSYTEKMSRYAHTYKGHSDQLQLRGACKNGKTTLLRVGGIENVSKM